MIARDDLRAAVGSGLISEKQAADLVSLADSRRGARENLNLGDEPFEFLCLVPNLPDEMEVVSDGV